MEDKNKLRKAIEEVKGNIQEVTGEVRQTVDEIKGTFRDVAPHPLRRRIQKRVDLILDKRRRP